MSTTVRPRRMRRHEAVPSDLGPLCAYCGDTIFTIGDTERRSPTGRKLRADKAYCGPECRREQYRTWVHDA